MQQIFPAIMKCFQSLQSKLNDQKVKHDVDKVFLSMDTRGSGSAGFLHCNEKSKNSHSICSLTANVSTTLLHMLYGNTTTLEEWDQSFNSVASVTAPSYIAILQKNIAANGVCLFTVGGGSFQISARKLHSKYHHNNCAFMLPEC